MRKWPKEFGYHTRTVQGRRVAPLLSAANPKLLKGLGVQRWLPWIMHLSPAKGSGAQTHAEMCPGRTPGCTAACLATAGRGGIFPGIRDARYKKTRWFLDDPDGFLEELYDQIARCVTYTGKYGLKPCIRLNGTSDVRWERVAPDLFRRFPTVQFYDYTKLVDRMGGGPPNYYLTFSATHQNQEECRELLAEGHNVSVVFRREVPLPRTWWNTPVINGDKTDLRFLDPKGRVVGLTYKVSTRYGIKAEEAAKRTGFIQNPASLATVTEAGTQDLEAIMLPQQDYAASQEVFGPEDEEDEWEEEGYPDEEDADDDEPEPWDDDDDDEEGYE